MTSHVRFSQRFVRPIAGALLGALGVVSVPAIASAQGGFAWACQPTSPSYTASTSCAPWSFNSRSGTVKVTRSSMGNYSVDFAGLGGRTVAGGIVHVTAYGAGNQVCKVVNWSSGGADFIVAVRCFAPNTGANADSAYDITVDWMGE